MLIAGPSLRFRGAYTGRAPVWNLDTNLSKMSWILGMRGSDEERRDPGEILESVLVPCGTKEEQGWPWIPNLNVMAVCIKPEDWFLLGQGRITQDRKKV